MLGSWLLVVAVLAHVYAVTGSVFATGLTLAADLFRVAAVARMVVGTPTAIYVAVVAESVGAVGFRPAAQAHVPAVVGIGAALSSAKSWNAATDGVVRLSRGTRPRLRDGLKALGELRLARVLLPLNGVFLMANASLSASHGPATAPTSVANASTARKTAAIRPSSSFGAVRCNAVCGAISVTDPNVLITTAAAIAPPQASPR